MPTNIIGVAISASSAWGELRMWDMENPIVQTALTLPSVREASLKLVYSSVISLCWFSVVRWLTEVRARRSRQRRQGIFRVAEQPANRNRGRPIRGQYTR